MFYYNLSKGIVYEGSLDDLIKDVPEFNELMTKFISESTQIEKDME